MNNNKLQLGKNTEEITYYYYICSNIYDPNKYSCYDICIYCGCLAKDHITKYSLCNFSINSDQDTGYGYCKICLNNNKICKIEDHNRFFG